MTAIHINHRQYLAFILVLIFSINTCSSLFAAIKNGYQAELDLWNLQVKGLENALTKEKHDDLQRRTLASILRHTKRYRDKLEKNRDLTLDALEQFKQIDPALYYAINNIKDKQGNVTDVYVKLIEDYGHDNGIYGTTNLRQCPKNRHVYVSSYGRHTVDVKVNSGRKALELLAHEFGHVRYQVPNLASYMVYFQQQYRNHHHLCTGHSPDDPSHLSVMGTTREFMDQYRQKKVK